MPSPFQVNRASSISNEDSDRIDGITPLLANINSGDEVRALEDARIAFNDYRQANTELRALLDNGDLEKATLFNTKAEPGTSEEAFNRFVTNIETARALNRTVFDDIWFAQRAVLPRNQVLYGVAAYGLVIVLVLAGVYHRYREL
jgi:hypothetical protein